MNFASPEFFALIVLLAPILWLSGKRRSTLGHSQVSMHNRVGGVPLLGRAPTVLLCTFWVALVATFAQPQLTEWSEKTTITTRNFLLDVDVSGSMDSALTVKGQQDFLGAPKPNADGSEPKPPTRADAAEAGARMFVNSPNRKGDRVGVILFNDQPYNVWPLSLDLNTINRKLFLISKYNAGGTNFSGPDDVNVNVGGVQAGINHLLEITKPDETRVLIMVTDGEDSINDKRFGELVDQLKKEHIRLYVLGVGESWGSGTKPDLQRLAEQAGGVVIPIGDTKAMQDGFTKIDQLEKTSARVDPISSERDISMWFFAASLVLGLLYLASIVLVRDDA